MGWLPQRASPDPGLTRRDDVDERAVRCHAVDRHFQPRCATDDARTAIPVSGDAGRDQARREPGECALHHARKHIIRSSRDREQRYVAAPLGDDAVGAITAKGNDRGGAKIAESLRGFGRVAAMAHDWHGKWRERQTRFRRGSSPLDDTVGIREIRDLADPGGVESEQYAPDDIDLLVIVERGAVSDEAANILTR